MLCPTKPPVSTFRLVAANTLASTGNFPYTITKHQNVLSQILNWDTGDRNFQ